MPSNPPAKVPNCSPLPLRAPSDLAQQPAGPVRVAGRLEAAPDGGWAIVDAFAALAVPRSSLRSCEPGDLVVLEGQFGPHGLSQPTVVERHRPPTPPCESPTPSRRTEVARLRGAHTAGALRVRAGVLTTVRTYFAERGFLEVDTPVLVPSPGLDVHLDAFEVRDHRGEPGGYLRTSPEYQMKRLLSGGLPRIFEIAHCFRSGEVGPLHNPEFLMLEWYRAFATMDELIDETEQLVRRVVTEHAGSAQLQLEGGAMDLASPFDRLSVGEAFERYAAIPARETTRLAADDEERFFRVLVERVEPALAAHARPVFLRDFPATLASLARRQQAEPTLCERFELYVGPVELCNGFGELTDPVEQRDRLRADQERRATTAKPVYPIDEHFLSALEQGMPPAAGNALGLDRLIALCAGRDRIADVQSFPVGWL